MRHLRAWSIAFLTVLAACSGPSPDDGTPGTSGEPSNGTGQEAATSTPSGPPPAVITIDPRDLVFGEPAFVGAFPGYLSDVAVTGSQIIAVGVATGSSDTDFVAAVYAATDPASWTEQLDVVPSDAFVAMTDVVPAGSGFIALGLGWDSSLGSNTSRLWNSPDGVTWSELEPGVLAGAEGFRDLEATESGFRLVTSSDDYPVGLWTSSDGDRWSQVETKGDDQVSIAAIAVTDSTYVGVGSRSLSSEPPAAAAWTSTDGVTWEFAWSEATADTGMNDVVVFGEWFVAVGFNGQGMVTPWRRPAIWVSRDGTEWERIDAPYLGAPEAFDWWAHLFGIDVYEDGLIVVGQTHEGPTIWQAQLP